jgi:hypothetical protein
LEQLLLLIWNLSSYSNSGIVEIAKGFVDLSKGSAIMAGDSHQAFVDCLAGSYTAGESRRCLALLYVCNEILSSCPREDSWHTVLAKAMSKFVPLICELALRQQENNVVLNAMRLPEVWKQQEMFSPELCNQMRVQCEIYHQAFLQQQQQRDRQRWVEAGRGDMRDMRGEVMVPAPVAGWGRGSGPVGGAWWGVDGSRDIIDCWRSAAQDDRGLTGGGLAVAGGASGLEGDGREGLDDAVTGTGMDEDLDFLLSSFVGAGDTASCDRGGNMTTRAGWGPAGAGARGIPLSAAAPPPPPPADGMGVGGGAGGGGLKVKEEADAVAAGLGVRGRMEGQNYTELQHLEELKLKEIAQERSSFLKMQQSTIQRMAETHRNRLITCRSQSETKKTVRQNEDEMKSVEAELARILAHKESQWAAAPLQW